MANHEQAKDANTDAPLAPMELSGSLRNYSFANRIQILRKHPLARFIGTGHNEVNDAFRALLYHDVYKKGTDRRLEDIADHARRTAPHGDEESRAARTVARITRNHIAYFEQAERDRRWLKALQDEITDSVREGYPYGSLLEYVVATGMHSYEGPGQLVRYLDAAYFVTGQPQADGRFTFGAELEKNNQGHSVVRDAFTDAHLMPSMADYQHAMLARVGMDVAPKVIGYAIENEARRQNFWEYDLFQASRQEVARPLAVTALRNLSA